MSRWRLTIGLLILVGGAIILLMPLASWLQDEWGQRQRVAEFEAGRAAEPTVTDVPANEPSAEPATPSPIVGLPSTEGTPQSESASLSALPIRLEIPALDLNYMVMPGIEDDQLRQGPGHYPQTPLPGAGGNAAFAGHRTVKGRPSYFYHLDKLKPGDAIRVTLPDRQLVYVVEQVYLTSPYDVGVLAETPAATLTLTTCDPPGLDDRRLIVRAQLQGAA